MNEFDPETVTPEQLGWLGGHIENFLDLYECAMIVPHSLKHKEKEEKLIRDCIRNLISMMKKGKISKVIRDPDD